MVSWHRSRVALAVRCAAATVLTVLVAALGVLGPVLTLGAGGAAVAAEAPSGGREPPDVRGLTLPEAVAVLEEQWYPESVGGYELIVRSDPEVPKGVPSAAARVTSQVVDGYLEDNTDDVNQSAAITLGVETIVPDLVGRTQDEADGLLGAAGLVLVADGEGLVVRQDPAAGDRVSFRSRVRAQLEPPPVDDARTVPALVGLTEAEARAAVTGVDLALEVGSSSGDETVRVSEQQPDAGTTVKVGDRVTVRLSGSDVPIELVVVPDVTGLDPDAVQRVLDVARLSLVVEPDGAQDEGLSFRQDPAPGARVDPGTTVTVAFAVVDEGVPASWTPAAGVGLLVLLVAGGMGLWAFRRARPHAPREPAGQPHIRVEPTADVAPRVTVRTPDPMGDLVVRVVPGPDLGTLTLTESSR